MKNIVISLMAFFAINSFAAEQPCKVKVYASTTAELSSSVAELYGFKRAPSLGYLTITCVNMDNFQSLEFVEPVLGVSNGDALQTLALKEMYEGTRVIYSTNFEFEHGKEMLFKIKTPLVDSDGVLDHSFSQVFYNR